MEKYTLRQVRFEDIQALAQLHATAWRETYESIYPGKSDWPTAELRAWQWRELFNKNVPDTWFCFVIENAAAELIGFTRGQDYNHESFPSIKGELNKIYLLRKYHKQGLGIQLFKTVVTSFISKGINNMLLFADPGNPTTKFFEKMGGKKAYAPNGEFHGTYVWDDLKVSNNNR